MRLNNLITALVVGTTLTLVSCSTEPPPPPSELQVELDALTRTGVVGAIATLDDGTTTTVTTSGVSDLSEQSPVGADDRVRIGSVTKTFTASLVLQLVSEGKVELDAPIARYLPGVLHGAIGEQTITVRQLLQHRSGLPEFAGEAGADEWIAANDNRTLTPAGAVAIALTKPAQFEPGTSFAYTNTNYIVLGILVEAVTGGSYAEALQARILDPLGLHDTYMPQPGERDIRGDHLDGYQDLGEGLVDVTRIEPSIPWSAGAMVSTGKDLNTFWHALLDGHLVPLRQLTEMTTPQVAATEAEGLGFGMGVVATELSCGVTYIGHSGVIRGYQTISGATSDRAFTTTITALPTGHLDIVAMISRAVCH